ncbi:MAG: type II toxin-antitoxin system VapC family toxin [Acidobacteria bacterium]|nr:type II toxin-antitoxin system VapC family toxin [Acidobacteriota bacterium]
MIPIFVDTHYFVASFQETDQWHQRVVLIESDIEGRIFVTTDAVLIEVLNYFSGYGPATRGKISQVIHEILLDSGFTVVEETRAVFLKALELYESRLDKGYSLTDCISMNVCRELGIKEILTHDRHFEQEGFKILL